MNAIPAGWSVQSFASLADYRAGRTPPRAESKYWNAGSNETPWVSIADMRAFGVIHSTKERVSDLALGEVFGGKLVPAGTLLMSFKLTIGRVATLGVPACHNEAIIAIYPKGEVDQGYLGYCLSQVDFEALQDRQIKGHTLNREKLDRIQLLVPPLSEQRTIATTLDICRRAADLHRRALHESEELKRATMQALFTRGLRGETLRESEIGPLPDSWALEPIEKRHAVISGGTPSRSRVDFWEGGTIPWVKTTEIQYRVIEDTEERITPAALAESAARMLPAGTLLMAMYGQGVTRGKVAILGIDAACNQACAAINAVQPGVETRYLFHFLTYRYDDIRALAHGGQQQNLSQEIVKGLVIAVPRDEQEQREIVAILDALDRKIDLHRRKHAVLDELFKSLLHQLMTGEIRVSDLNLDALADATTPSERTV